MIGTAQYTDGPDPYRTSPSRFGFWVFILDNAYLGTGMNDPEKLKHSNTLSQVVR